MRSALQRACDKFKQLATVYAILPHFDLAGHPLRKDAFMAANEMSLPLPSFGGHMNPDAVIVSGGAPMKVTLLIK